MGNTNIDIDDRARKKIYYRDIIFIEIIKNDANDKGNKY